jgi:hypothetical protein
MYKVMATFKELKTKLQGEIIEETPTEETLTEDIKSSTLEEESLKPKNTLELEEARYLLSLVANSDFSGKDIQIVYNVALKLQQIIENTLNIEDVKNKR